MDIVLDFDMTKTLKENEEYAILGLYVDDSFNDISDDDRLKVIKYITDWLKEKYAEEPNVTKQQIIVTKGLITSILSS